MLGCRAFFRLIIFLPDPKTYQLINMNRLRDDQLIRSLPMRLLVLGGTTGPG